MPAQSEAGASGGCGDERVARRPGAHRRRTGKELGTLTTAAAAAVGEAGASGSRSSRSCCSGKKCASGRSSRAARGNCPQRQRGAARQRHYCQARAPPAPRKAGARGGGARVDRGGGDARVWRMRAARLQVRAPPRRPLRRSPGTPAASALPLTSALQQRCGNSGSARARDGRGARFLASRARTLLVRVRARLREMRCAQRPGLGAVERGSRDTSRLRRR